MGDVLSGGGLLMTKRKRSESGDIKKRKPSSRAFEDLFLVMNASDIDIPKVQVLRTGGYIKHSR